MKLVTLLLHVAARGEREGLKESTPWGERFWMDGHI